MKIYKAILDPEGWNEPVIIGYFTNKEKAWEECYKSHLTYKSFRMTRYYDDDKHKWEYWYYSFHYKCYYLEEIEVRE